MCRLSEAELCCVSTKILMTSELMQFEIGTSTRRYFPPRGTAGFERCAVNGNKRVPAPPPRITARRLCFWGIRTWARIDGKCGRFQGSAAQAICSRGVNHFSEQGLGCGHDKKPSLTVGLLPGLCNLRSIPGRSAAVAFHAGGFLRDLDAHAGADTGSAGLDHFARIVEIFDSA